MVGRMIIHAVFWSVFLFMGSAEAMGLEDGGTRILFAFDDPAQGGEWRAVNDGVMGGVSEGRFRITEAGRLEFSGNISLENNGGFASMRSSPRLLGLRPGDVILVRLRGDGRRYLLNLYVPGSRTAFSYRAGIQTTGDEWTEVRIPVERFRASLFGRQVDDPVEVERVHSLGFMLSDGKPGPFRLEIESITVAGAGSRG
jgi:monofunctional biosynthetic peptidoglycan transglycosylase